MAGPVLKTLGQVGSPTADTTTFLYQVPANTSVVISKMTITNTSATATTVWVSVMGTDTACLAKHGVVTGVTIAGNDSIDVLQGVTIAAGGCVCVKNILATVNFHLFGQENS